jgi:flagellar biosynthetic protein FliR
VTEAAFFAFLLVFLRCSAMFLTCPVFGAGNTPLQVRIFTGVAVSAALAVAIRPQLGPLPAGMYELVCAGCRELLAGALIGIFTSLAIQTLQMAGGFMDLQTGLGSSRALNPLSGVESTVLSQLKSTLAVGVFLAADAHHLMIAAFVRSYHFLPSFGAIESSYVSLISQMLMLAIQIAAPVMAVGFLVDAALALMTRAVPQMQVMQVGMPAKVGVGIATVAVGLPMAVVGVNAALTACFHSLGSLFHI